jgi:transcription antitermination protein NusB
MANRHLARSIVMQTLFEWDFSHRTSDDASLVLQRNISEFAPGVSDGTFMDELLRGILSKQKDLDVIIKKAAPDWPLEKISTVDRNILRIGLYELLFSDHKEVPPKVAINEAIELAKSFGGDTSGKFVNGVLGAVYKEMGEPGKDETSPKRKFDKNIPDSALPVEILGGAIVYAQEGDNTYLALVHDVFGHWTLSKGHLDPDEKIEVGVSRVVSDEIGVPITVEEKLGDNEYIAFDPDKGKIKKRVTYYLAKADYVDLELRTSGGLDDARWFPIADIADLNFYGDILPLITKGVSLLAEKNNAAKRH